MKSRIIKDTKRRRLYCHYEKKRMILKFLQTNGQRLKGTRIQKRVSMSLYQLQFATITVLRRRCTVTGEARSVFKSFRLSRRALKLFCYKGLIPGLYKSNH